MKEEIETLEARRRELGIVQRIRPASVARLHPRLADPYREKVAHLQEELNRTEVRSEAAEAIRGLIREIRLIPKNDRLEIELVGDLPAILAFANATSRRPVATGVQITMVAGEGFEPPTLEL
jgi:site-specific DNA recombinase